MKISAYSDQRISPAGILPLMDRLLEAKERYKNKAGISMNNPKTDLLIQCAVEIEKQIFQYCNTNPDDISNDVINKYIDQLKTFEI